MAASDSQDYTGDFDPEEAIRQRILAQQQGSDPSAPAPAAPAAAAPVPTAQFADASQPPVTGSYDPTGASAGQPDTSNTPAPPPPAPAPDPSMAPGAQPSSAGAGDPGNASNAIAGYYSSFLGRSAAASEISGWLNSGLSLGDIQNGIANSPEAAAYAKSHAAQTPAPVQSSGGGGGGSSAGASPTTAQTFASVNSSTLADNPFLDQIRALIQQRLQSVSTPVDPNAPEISASLSAAQDQNARQSKLERSQLAERLYGQGQGALNTDALTRNIQQSNEKNATSQATLKSTLIMNEYNQKASELQNLLQLAVSSGDADSARMVQLQLAALQAQVQREGIGANLAIAGQGNNNITVASAA